MFTSPDKGDVLKTGSVYTARWTGQSNSDQAQVTLKATDPSCWNVGLVAEGERGCSAIELGKAKLSDGSFQLRLQPGVSPLLPVVEWNGPLAARDSKTKYVLFFDVPSGRITSPEFTVQGNDFVITPTIEKFSLHREKLFVFLYAESRTQAALFPLNSDFLRRYFWNGATTGALVGLPYTVKAHTIKQRSSGTS